MLQSYVNLYQTMMIYGSLGAVCTQIKLTPARGAFKSYILPEENKQLLDEVFVISRIIKVEVGVISRSRHHKNRV